METKEELVQRIKEWIEMDNEIIEYQTKIKKIKNEKKNITTLLLCFNCYFFKTSNLKKCNVFFYSFKLEYRFV